MLATQDVYPSSTAHLTKEERCERLREQAFIIDMPLLSFARESAEFAVTKAWEEEGSETAIDWLRFNCHMTSNAAADLIAVGKNLGRMPDTVQAVCQGEIGVAHVKAMARTANAVGTKFEEAPLLEKARENSPGKFYYICNHYRHAADRQGYEAEQARLAENRRLWITTPKAARPCEPRSSRWRASPALTTTAAGKSDSAMPWSIFQCMPSTAV